MPQTTKNFDLNKEEKDVVIRWLGLCKWEIPMIEEIQSTWRDWVLEPVNQKKIHAREARALLEIAGVYADKGVSVFDLIARLVTEKKGAK